MNGFLLLQEASEAALRRALGSSLTEGFFCCYFEAAAEAAYLVSSFRLYRIILSANSV